VRAAARVATPLQPAAFGLLVVPVDFTDLRLPPGWDPTTLDGRLYPRTGETLTSYFRTASGGRLELRILLSPLVHLDGRRRDYSDVGYSGNERSRALAREALAKVAALGLDFRLLDTEGPDRRAGSADDDGEVDGVLLLHSGPGRESDLQDGLIDALQYYLETPVRQGGVAARMYAVASMHSGLGIWAHETAHLLGLEDRYDPYHPVSDDDPVSRGGLGIFSLMAAGAWGCGDGSGAALLDAYSAAQLGWCEVTPVRQTGAEPDTLRPWLAGGQVWRVWKHGLREQEYFLLETRGGEPAGPFDAMVAPGQLLVYHVDESLPEGVASAGSERHLRVALVEADGDGRLAAADPQDRGRAEDLFPGPLGVTELTPFSSPDSHGYSGPSEVSLLQITSLPEGVALRVSDAAFPGFQVGFGLSDDPLPRVELAATPTGGPVVTSLEADLKVLSLPAWGRFAGGTLERRVALTVGADGVWRPAETVSWQPDPLLPAGAATTFQVRLMSGDGWVGSPTQHLWLWRPVGDPLDLAGWPANWQIVYPEQDSTTTWHLWPGEGALTADESPVLACTGTAYTTPASWPDARYSNEADAALITPPLAAGTEAVLLVHALEAESIRPSTAQDGAVVELLQDDGTVVPLAPLDGYDGRVSAQALNALHDRDCFIGEDALGTGGPAAWRVDLLPLPETGTTLRLRLRLASDPLWRRRGWFVCRLQAVGLPGQGSAFPVTLSTGGDARICWTWPWSAQLTATHFALEQQEADGSGWQRIWEGMGQQTAAGGRELEMGTLALGGARSDRVVLRVLADTPVGWITSRPVVWYADGGAGSLFLDAPYPNPSRGEVRILLELPADDRGRLTIYDLRGQLVRRWDLLGGRRLLVWDGRDQQGRRVAAATYLLRLRQADGGREVVRKVTLTR
jgi:M6 family metalloprotease-like protein